MSVPDPIHWSFPLPRTHTGLLLGNGLQGLMIWGSHSLNITFGRAGFWDHRGGNAFTSRTTYDEVRRLLEADDHATLRTLFQLPGDSGSPNPSTQRPDRPRQLGGGRLELHFDQGYIPVQGTLHPGDGHAEILLRAPSQQEALVTIYQARGQEVAWISLPGSLRATVRLVPAWDHVHAELEPIGIQPPHRWQSADGGGFEQTLPEDDPLALAWHRDGATLVVATALGPGAAARAAESAATAPLPRLATESATWWRAYWDEMPTLSLPDPVLQEAWAYGAFKQAGLTAPCDVAATLQGPWMEEYQIPPWSNDYHFNINVEMIYWPALATGRWSHFEPLWRMIHRWMPELRANGQAFFKNPGALMLPHAVDDRCAAVGAFWTGMIDHACSAWMAQMAWLHYRYSLDETVLRETAWPLLVGAFEGYWSMLEDDGEALRLPVSVSPEFKGARTDAWGRNASFQLAACHMLASILPRAAALLGHPLDPRWSEVATRLPAYATVTTSRQKEYPEGQATRIALWEGMDLLESHRHHSHLGGICPFATIDPGDPRHREIVRESFFHWVRTGAGAWSGWCVPWAAILCARMGWADGAISWLHWWHQVFTNEGRGTLHDAHHPGNSTLFKTGSDATATPDDANMQASNREIMQADAGMGVVTAILELLVQCRPDGIHLLPSLPTRWRTLTFDGIHAEGGFQLGATVRNGRVTEVRVTARAASELILHLPHPGPWTGHGLTFQGPVLRRRMNAGECLALASPAPA